MRWSSISDLHAGIKSRGDHTRLTSPLFDKLIWMGLALALSQAYFCSSDWGYAWVGLGILAVWYGRQVEGGLVLSQELPVLLALVAYSVTTLHLGARVDGFEHFNEKAARSAAWVAWQGTFAFWLGQVLAMRQRYRIPWPRVQGFIRLTTRDAWWIYGIGFLSQIGLLKSGGGTAFAILFVFAFCAPLGLFIILEIHDERGDLSFWVGSFRFWIWVVALVEWALSFMMSGIFGGTLIILFIYFLQYARRFMVVAAVLIVLCALGAPILQDTKSSYREILQSHDGEIRELAQQIKNERMRIGKNDKRNIVSIRAVEGGDSQRKLLIVDLVRMNLRKIFIEGDVWVYYEGIEKLMQRVCQFDIWLAVKEHVDFNRDFAGGKTILNAVVYSVIPRFIWSDKPNTGGSNELAEKYADMTVHEGTSVSVGTISELYLNGGEWWVFVGMAILGGLTGMILKVGWTDSVQPLGRMMALGVFCGLLRTDQNFSDVLGGMVRYAFLWGILRFWMLYRYRRNLRQTKK